VVRDLTKLLLIQVLVQVNVELLEAGREHFVHRPIFLMRSPSYMTLHQGEVVSFRRVLGRTSDVLGSDAVLLANDDDNESREANA
jgi:hypothetical protein